MKLFMLSCEHAYMRMGVGVCACSRVHVNFRLGSTFKLVKESEKMVVAQLKTSESVSKLQMHTRAQTKAYAYLINTNIELTLVKSPSEKQPQTICSPSLTPFAQTKSSHQCTFL